MLSYFLFIALVIEISTIFLVLTGLNKEIARYQAISMLTNTGFTTDEAKLILDHPTRRRISTFLILFGAFSLAVIISIISTFLADDVRIIQMAVILAVVAVLFLFLKTKPVRKILEKKFESNLKDNYQLDELPIKDVLYLNEDDFLIDIPFYKESGYIESQCGDIFEKEKDIHLLFIRRGEEVIRKKLDEETIHAGDLLFVYGNKKLIDEKFQKELDSRNEKEEDETSL